MLKVSVALAVYNGEQYITALLQSLKNQIRKPDEIVIVDDKSTDSSVEIVKRFIEENELDWRLIENKENLGYRKNFRKAISLTSGDLVFLCDQDDVWCEDKIESITGIFTQHSDILSVNSSFTVIDGDGHDDPLTEKRGTDNYGMLPKRFHNPFGRVRLPAIFHRNISPGCTMAVRRELADDYVRLTKCELPHDYELNLMAAAKHSLYFYNVPLIKYRIHSSNTIGLSVRQQSRIEIATEKLSAANAANGYGGAKGLVRLCEKRLHALQKVSFFGVMGLWLIKEYYKYYPFRERIGDILYILGRR